MEEKSVDATKAILSGLVVFILQYLITVFIGQPFSGNLVLTILDLVILVLAILIVNYFVEKYRNTKKRS